MRGQPALSAGLVALELANTLVNVHQQYVQYDGAASSPAAPDGAAITMAITKASGLRRGG